MSEICVYVQARNLAFDPKGSDTLVDRVQGVLCATWSACP